MKAATKKTSATPRKPLRNPRMAEEPPAQLPLVSVTETKIGLRLKHGRLAKGQSLRQVAEAIGCSESFISKIENDKVRPSLTVLHRLVETLEININALFSPPQNEREPVKIMPAGARPTIRVNAEWQGTNILLEQMMPQAEGALLQANIHHVAPGGSSAGQIRHEGEELGWVINGVIELVVDNVIYGLKAGDSFFFSSMLEHGYRNPGKKPARVFWVNSPPSF